MSGPEVFILTVSDRVSRGQAEDTSGPYISPRLLEWNSACRISLAVCPDERMDIREKFELFTKAGRGGPRLFVTTGGTGLAPRDVTVRTLAPLLDYQATGVMSAIVAKCIQQSPFAMLSNPLVGVFGDWKSREGEGWDPERIVSFSSVPPA